MNYSVEVDFCETYELLSSLGAYMSKKSHKSMELGGSWAKEIRKQISPEFNEELKNASKIPADLWPDALLYECPSSRKPEDFIQWLRDQPIGDLYQRVSLYAPEGGSSLHNLEKWRQQIVYLLSKWNEQYFQYVDPAIIQGLTKDAINTTLLMKDLSSDELVETVTNGIQFDSIEGLNKVLLVPQYHYRPLNMVSHYKGLYIYNYPCDALPSNPEEPSPSLMRLTRGISDENRIRILRFLSEEEKSFTEIVNYIGLAKSTVHHHMISLRASGLVRVHISKMSQRYSLREGTLDELSSKLEAYLKK